MTNERAIELLNRISDSQFDGIHGDERREALEMAVRALSGDVDTISRQQAIDAVVRAMIDGADAELVEGIMELLPSAQPEVLACRSGELVQESGDLVQDLVKDCISRKMAIDAMRKLPKWNIMREDYKNVGFSYDDVMFTLEKLTSAQPEIIRCKDCKNWDTTWINDFSPNYHYCPMVDGVRKEDWYCADAERRTDVDVIT